LAPHSLAPPPPHRPLQELQGNPSARPPTANPLLLGLTPGAYVLKVLAGVRSAELEQALLALPFTDALKLLAYLAAWLKQVSDGRGGPGPLPASLPPGCSRSCGVHQGAAGTDSPLLLPSLLPCQGGQAELACRVAVLLLRLHHAQFVATPGARHVLVKLQRRLRTAMQVGGAAAAGRAAARGASSAGSVAAGVPDAWPGPCPRRRA
jgi:U3 small nucleolar RNA-associated protein 12